MEERGLPVEDELLLREIGNAEREVDEFEAFIEVLKEVEGEKGLEEKSLIVCFCCLCLESFDFDAGKGGEGDGVLLLSGDEVLQL